MAWEAGASGSLTKSHVEGWVTVFDDANVLVEDNEMPATCMIAWGSGADVTIRGNTIHGCEYEKGIEVSGSNTALIEGNTIWVEEADPGPQNPVWGGRDAIQVTGSEEGSDGGTIVIRDNDLRDSLVGVNVLESDASIEVSGNRITDNGVALKLNFGAVVQFTDNILCGNDADYDLAIGMDESEFVAANDSCEADATE